VITKIKIFYNESGFTLIEISIAFLILSLVSTPIFYNCFQATNNLIMAQKYYNTTLDAQNILVNIKNHLDKNLDIIEEDLKQLLDSLNLNTKTFTYELYFYDLNGESIFNYYYPFKNENCKPKIKFETNNFIYDSNLNDSLKPCFNKLILNNENTLLASINLNTQPSSIDIKNYKSENIEVNIYSNENVKYIDNLKLQSLAEGSIRINYYNQYPVEVRNYIIVVSIKDNKNKILNQIFDIYSKG